MSTHLLEGCSDLSALTPGRSSQSDTGQPVPADRQTHGETPGRKDICKYDAFITVPAEYLCTYLSSFSKTLNRVGLIYAYFVS